MSEENNKTVSIFEPIETLIRRDHEYAWAWHCNIAMAIFDSGIVGHHKSNLCAAAVMERLFGVNTEQFEEFRSIFSNQSKSDLKTSDEWLKSYPYTSIHLHNLDGWDRTNFDFSFYQEKITREEFLSRCKRSTLLSII